MLDSHVDLSGKGIQMLRKQLRLFRNPIPNAGCKRYCRSFCALRQPRGDIQITPHMFQLTSGTYATRLSSRQDIDRLLRRAKYADCCFPPNAHASSADGGTEGRRVPVSYWTWVAITSYFAPRFLAKRIII